MRYFPFLLFSIIVFEGFIAPVNPFDKKEEDRQISYYRTNKIRTETIYQISYIGDTLAKETLYYTVNKIDVQGHVIDKINYSPLGVSMRTTRTYSKNKLVNVRQWDYRLVLDTNYSEYDITYDETGRQKTEVAKYGSGIIHNYSWSYENDSLSRITSAFLGITDPRGQRYGEIWNFRYDSGGNVTEADYFNREFSSKITYRYNQNGQVTELNRYKEDAFLEVGSPYVHLTSRTVFNYNNEFRLAECLFYNDDGTLRSTDVYEYSKGGLIKQVTHYYKGAAQYVLQYQYTFYK